MAKPARLDLAADDGAAQRLRPLTVAELKAMGAPRWLIRGLMRQKSLILIYGASGSGKSFVGLDLAIAIVTGQRWNGARVVRGGVIYVAGEGHLADRLDAIQAERNLTDDELANFRIVPANVNLLAAGADLLPLIDQVKAAARSMGGVMLVILDTLNSMMVGGNENASEDMGTMMAAARMIISEVGCAVVYVHHSGKDEDRGPRGHSSSTAAVETEILIKKGDGFRTIKVRKQRDGESDAEWAFKLRPVDLGPSDDPDADEGERRASCVVEMIAAVPETAKKPPKRDVALDALRAAIADHGTRMPGTSTIPPGVMAVALDRWRKRFRVLSGDDYQADRVADAAFRRERMKLLQANKVQCSGDYAWLA